MEAGENKYPAELARLRNLREFIVPSSPALHEFGRFLAERVTPKEELSPVDFVMIATLALNDLEKGRNGFTQEPIRSGLTGLPKGVYVSFRNSLPTIAHAIYPADFAQEVDKIFAEFRSSLPSPEEP